MTAGPINRALLQSFYQNPGQVYDDTKTEGAFGVIADQTDDNWNYVAGLAAGGSLQPYPFGVYRQAFINGGFDFWQRGTISTGKEFLADRWRLLCDGVGQVHTVSRQEFTQGQTEVPGNPNFYWQYTISTAPTGQTFNALLQRIEHASLFSGSKMTLSYYAKAVSDKQIIVKATQDFGTGGSPSARVTFETAAAVTATGNWQRFAHTFTVPSVAGKTFGTNGDDYLEVALWFPNNDTYVIGLSQLQLNQGEYPLPYQPRHITEELLMCQRYYEKSYDYFLPPATITADQGFYFNFGTSPTTVWSGEVRFQVPKSKKPVITLYDQAANSGKVSGWNGSSSTNNFIATVDQQSEKKFRVLAQLTSGYYEFFGHYVAEAEF